MTQDPATLQSIIEDYEKALRLLLHNADKNDKVFQFCQSPAIRYSHCDEEY